MKKDRLTQFLVVCFALYQLGHLLSNIRAAFVWFSAGEVAFPAVPPPGGWSVDMVHVFMDMATMDSINAVVSLVFVWAFFRGKSWALWLGTITTTLSFYAAILFNLSAYQAGAWVGPNLWVYLFINITYVPIALLWGKVIYLGYKNR